jgi:hypothetical protein
MSDDKIFGHRSGGYLTQQAGYQNYQAVQSPDEAGKFNGYQASQVSPGLAAQLQAQQAGGTSSMAQNQLKSATQQNLAGQLAAAASSRGNQNPGQDMRNLANQGAQTNQDAALQSAQVAGQQQLQGQQQLGQIGSQQAQLSQQANQFNSQAQQNLAGLQNQQNQFQNQLGYNIQNAQNQADLNFAMANNNSGNQLTNSLATNLAGAGAGALTGGGSLAAGAAAAAGKVITLPGYADGGVVDSSATSDASAAQMRGFLQSLDQYSRFDQPAQAQTDAMPLLTPSKSAPSAPKPQANATDTYTGASTGTASPNISPGTLQSPEAIDPNAGNLALTTPQMTAAQGYQPSASVMPAYAKGGVLNGPEVLPTADGPVLAGEAGKEAVVPMGDKAAIVPVKADGDPDEDRAKDPEIQALLNHPDFIAALKDIVSSGRVSTAVKRAANG